MGPWFSDGASRGSRTVKSAERTLALFELFALSQAAMTVGEISKALNIPQPSVSMLLKNLVKLGYIEHDRAARTYVPTIRIMLLGSWIHRRFNSHYDLDHDLDELHARIGETILLGIQNGIYSQYVSAQLPEEPHRLDVQSGLLRPITCTAIGRVLLSLKPDSEVALLARRCNAEVKDERLRVNPAEFSRLIAKIRQDGYARTCGDMTAGYSAVAVAIPGPVGKIPLAIGAGGPTDRIDRKFHEILAALIRCKSHLERKADARRPAADQPDGMS